VTNGTAVDEDTPAPSGTNEERIEGVAAQSLRSVLRRRWVYELAYAMLVLGAAALILSLVGRAAGWPLGGEYFNELILVPLYAAHFRHLDFFPVWSSSDGLGLGTPVLLYYQKAFFYVAGAIFILLGGALKPTLVVTIGIFLAVGAYGMRRALQMVTDSRLLQVVGSVGFLFTNYVFTDWLARGDLPEFSAMMIVPWLLFWCLNLVKNRRVSLLLIPIMALLVDAHSAIGLLSLFTLAVTMITFVGFAGLKGLRAIAPRLIVAVAGATVLLAPTLLAELRFSQYFDPASKVTHFAAISNDFVGFGSYFYQGSHRWLVASNVNFVQIDFAIWIPIGIALVAAIIFWAITGKRPDRTPWGRCFNGPSMVLLLTALCIYLVLQLRISLAFYQFLSPLESIDYPYRMLAFITPIGVILVVAIGHSIFRSFPTSALPKVVALVWLMSLIVISPITSTWSVPKFPLTPPGQFPGTWLSVPLRYVNYETYDGFVGFDGILFDEYLPKVYDSEGGELYDDGALYHQLHSHQHGAASLSAVPCSVTVPTRSPLESLELTYSVTCAGGTRFALPVTFNAYSSVFAKTDGQKLHKIRYYHVATDPRIIIDIPSSKTEHIVVHLPTLWGVLG
jgi:hypothetical protein